MTMQFWEYEYPVSRDRWNELLRVLVRVGRQKGKLHGLPWPERAQFVRELDALLHWWRSRCGWKIIPWLERGEYIRAMVLWYRRGKVVRVVVLWEVVRGENIIYGLRGIPRNIWQVVWPERALRLQERLRARAQARLGRIGLTLPPLGPRLFPKRVRVLPRARAALVDRRSLCTREEPFPLLLVAGMPPVVLWKVWRWPPQESHLVEALGISPEVAARLLRDEILHTDLLGEIAAAQLARTGAEGEGRWS